MERYVAAHADAAAEVERLREVAAGIGAAGASRPPVALRDRLLHAAERPGRARSRPTSRCERETDRFESFLSTLDDADLGVADRRTGSRCASSCSTSRRSTARSSTRPPTRRARTSVPTKSTAITAARPSRSRRRAVRRDRHPVPAHAAPADRAARPAPGRPARRRLRPRRHARRSARSRRGPTTTTSARALGRDAGRCPTPAVMRTMAELAMRSLPLALAVRGTARPGLHRPARARGRRAAASGRSRARRARRRRPTPTWSCGRRWSTGAGGSPTGSSPTTSPSRSTATPTLARDLVVGRQRLRRASSRAVPGRVPGHAEISSQVGRHRADNAGRAQVSLGREAVAVGLAADAQQCQRRCRGSFACSFRELDSDVLAPRVAALVFLARRAARARRRPGSCPGSTASRRSAWIAGVAAVFGAAGDRRSRGSASARARELVDPGVRVRAVRVGRRDRAAARPSRTSRCCRCRSCSSASRSDPAPRARIAPVAAVALVVADRFRFDATLDVDARVRAADAGARRRGARVRAGRGGRRPRRGSSACSKRSASSPGSTTSARARSWSPRCRPSCSAPTRWRCSSPTGPGSRRLLNRAFFGHPALADATPAPRRRARASASSTRTRPRFISDPAARAGARAGGRVRAGGVDRAAARRRGRRRSA